MGKVITRFAPSPTGPFHVGGARTALFNYLFAKQHDGVMLLRIEDTDKDRSKSEFEKDVLDGLSWLGIEWEGDVPTRQSERAEIYKKALGELIVKDAAYVSEEREGERKKVIRFKNPNKEVAFNDLIRGEVKFNTTELEDFVIAKSEEEPLYHLAVVIDDNDMGVTHVIRGEDHISNTARQILIQEALGFERPIYAHIPLILAPDRSKLSKRHGAVSVNEFRKLGYLPEALVNYLALLGWHPEDDKEIFSMRELVKAFQIEKIQKGGAVFDIEKLNWLNREYIKELSDKEFKQHIAPYHAFDTEVPGSLIPVLRERISKFSDVKEMGEAGELDYYFREPSYDWEKLIWKDGTRGDTKKHLQKVTETLKEIDDNDFEAEIVKAALWKYSEKEGRGDVLWPMRYALSGRDKSPDPFTLAEILGKAETLSRLERAILKL